MGFSIFCRIFVDETLLGHQSPSEWSVDTTSLSQEAAAEAKHGEDDDGMTTKGGLRILNSVQEWVSKARRASV